MSTLILLCAGTLGGFLAFVLGLPMPFMMGSIAASGVLTIGGAKGYWPSLSFRKELRGFFISTIGALIGLTITPDALSLLPQMLPSLVAVVAFVVLAQTSGTLLFHRYAGYDAPTALLAAMPGGLIEAMTIGETIGANATLLTVQHFARIILVIITVPLLFWALTGEAVGSAAGQTLGDNQWSWPDVALILGLAALGRWIGSRLHLPASQLIGALVLAGAFNISGLWPLHSPSWLLNTAQIAVGTGLGAQFAGISLSTLSKSLGYAVLSVAMMLSIAFGLTLLVAPLSPFHRPELFISYAPGGVSEMGLIALSLNISPVVVVTHHLTRIILTVSLIGPLSRRLQKA